MPPSNQQPGWKYNPDNAKPSEPGTLEIDHSQEPPEPMAPAVEAQTEQPSRPAEVPNRQPEPKPTQENQTKVDSQEPPEPSAVPQSNPNDNNVPAPAIDDEVVWTASEYIHHERGMGWYAALFIGAILASGLAYLITKDVATSVIFVILAAIVAGFATRKPSVIEYRVAGDGIHIAQKFYPFNLFKSYSVVYDGGLKSIMLTPLKRFMPPISMYYSPDDEPKIVNMLSNKLPQAQTKPEAVERLARRLKL